MANLFGALLITNKYKAEHYELPFLKVIAFQNVVILHVNA